MDNFLSSAKQLMKSNLKNYTKSIRLILVSEWTKINKNSKKMFKMIIFILTSIDMIQTVLDIALNNTN